MFDNNFGIYVDRFSKFFHQVIRKKNSLCTYYKDLHLICNMLLHYLVKFENPKMLPNFHVVRDV